MEEGVPEMNHFIDCEFNEDGRTIDLISIAIVAEDGREYQAVSKEFDWDKACANEWLRINVIRHLPTDHFLWKPRNQIAAEIVEFVGKSPEFWGDYASYDWVALCQLYGRMIDLPDTWPMFINDVQQLKRMVGHEDKLPDAENEHDALSDARNVRDRHNLLIEYPGS